MNIKGIIFDLDGVIVDTAKYHYIAWKELSKKLNLSFTELDNEKLKGVSRLDSLSIILALNNAVDKYSDEEKEKLSNYKNDIYLNYIDKMQKDELLPGVELFLKDIKLNGYKIALGSASKNAKMIINKLGIEGYFDAIVDGNMVSKAKPNPEIFLKCANLLNVAPSECIVFEDAEAGIKAAQSAKMKCVAVGEDLSLNHADLRISTFSNINIYTVLNDLFQHILIDSWKIIEDKLIPNRTKASESLFSIGNGIMGQRANFEEKYSGQTLMGSYIGGVYYPDKTRVGWWKNGYPEYFAKVLNSAFWIGINVWVDGIELDLYKSKVISFYRELNMKTGVLLREFSVELENKKIIKVRAERFISLYNTELGAIEYSITPVNFSGNIKIESYVDADVRNEDSNYNEKFWDLEFQDSNSIVSKTKKTDFKVCWSMENVISPLSYSTLNSTNERLSEIFDLKVKNNETVTLHKFVGITSSLNYKSTDLLIEASKRCAKESALLGYDIEKCKHTIEWENKWSKCDIEIIGDDKAQQGIRYCIFMLLQTYTGVDSRLNIGPKGFTGEKYGGSTYWDTEAYCLPFYLATAGQSVAKQLLIYRYNQLDKAIENGEKLGFKNGAALYPMVTMNGEECHNEWEITFEEIHRNGAIVYAIYNYIKSTGDKEYLSDYGLEVIISVARFWAQRFNFSEHNKKYVMLGVTGPNEYENNVNNNWYTNYIANWCIKYAIESSEYVKENFPSKYKNICERRGFNLDYERKLWEDIITDTYFPKDEKLNIFLQQDGYLDKVQMMADELPAQERPINQHWSWDRILRSCFIKQADVLQGMYFFYEQFSNEEVKRNFNFYEPRTLHESSLSPCVHSILASRIGNKLKAYEMYLRTSRLDLDDYNKEVNEGLHITSMAGSWLAVAEGFCGLKMTENNVTVSPSIPDNWESISIRVMHNDKLIKFTITQEFIEKEILKTN